MSTERNPRILTENDINLTVAPLVGPSANVYLENTEWATSSGVATFDFASANDPYAGTVSIETTADMGASNYISFLNTSAISAGVNELKMWFKCKVLMNLGASGLDVQLYNGGSPVGNSVSLFGTPATTFGVNGANTLSYQEASIPFSNFGYFGLYDEIRVSSGIGPSQREFFLDDVKVVSGVNTGGGSGSGLTETVNINNQENGTVYVTLGYYLYAGSANNGISKIEIGSQRNNSTNTYDLRVIDITNSNVIAEANALSSAAGVEVVNDLGAISNLPIAPTVFEIQAKRDNLNPGATIVFVRSVKFTF